MSDVPGTDDVRDIWVDYHLNNLPRAEGIALVPEYQQAFDTWLDSIREDEKQKADLAISFWEHENETLKAKLAASKAVCGYREEELLKLKGPCSTEECRLHYAHSGPCDIEHPRGAARIAHEGGR